MNTQDLLLALLLAVPPWMGFLIFRYKGRVGLSYAYFLGGILAVLAIPWPQLGPRGLPAAHLGGALLGFIFFLQAHREGRNGIRNLAVGVGGSTLFAWILGTLLDLHMSSVAAFWGTALLAGSLWLLLADLGYRLTGGRWLSLRMPAAGMAAFLAVTAIHHLFTRGTPPLSWTASLLAGLLLGLVALHQLVWLRDQGIWVEGRGDGFRTALSALEGDQPPAGPSLAFAIESRQAMFLVNEKGMLLESNTAFSRMVGLPRHRMKGYQIQDLFQGDQAPAWEELKAQLLTDSRGSTSATLVRRDSSFRSVGLEAVAFDRNMALVWIAERAPGTLTVHGEGVAPLYAGSSHPDLPPPPRVPALPVLEALLPRLQAMLPEGFTAALRADAVTLLLEREALERTATQLMLHGRQGLRSGTLTLILTRISLADRPWARLSVEGAGPASVWDGEFLGLGWLHTTVQECSGLLDLDRGGSGSPLPRILLPCLGEEEAPVRHLEGRRLWILHRDSTVSARLVQAVTAAGGEARAFPDLPALLKAARRGPAPEALVLERTRSLERHRIRLGRHGGNMPVLLLDDGRPLPLGEGLPPRLVLLEKPFPGPDFLPAILALIS